MSKEKKNSSSNNAIPLINDEVSKIENEKVIDWKTDTSQLDDYQFRKTLTKKNEKVIIDDTMGSSHKLYISNELSNFLNALNLMKYYDIFINNCFDDLLSILGKSY